MSMPTEQEMNYLVSQLEQMAPSTEWKGDDIRAIALTTYYRLPSGDVQRWKLVRFVHPHTFGSEWLWMEKT